MTRRHSNELSAQELAERAPVWDALADFWLDTELADFQFDHIARTIVASPYTLAQVRVIHDTEVAPVLWRNLAHITGDWAGFDKAWLVASCAEQATRRHSFAARIRHLLLRPRLRTFCKTYWVQVESRVTALQTADKPLARTKAADTEGADA